ncbi:MULTISPECIES: PAS domain S-box protein [unclassified Xanthomonas]|uniref:PAS domain-containing sensor histidine kinase n=1 Tax=unclassified Xanthomonas TaxID=2643310 RepID=UPI0017CC7051|nr:MULTISPECIES: PAS domain S-box protein [unclassified Xanthomonas]MBB6365968.1 PAS domain S-box-containing protein [Xanthomonas sp. F10]UYC10232.1 PAS domain-containing sensor histidine kinase [Xanthomonas sp. CFBP 8445]
MQPQRDSSLPIQATSGMRLAQRLDRGIWRAVLLYVLLGLALSIGSDLVLAHFVDDPGTLIALQLVNDALFLALTAVALYYLLRPLVRAAVQAHTRLALSEAGYRQMFHANPSPMLVYDLETLRILDVNPAAVAFFGWSHDEFVGLELSRLWPPSVSARLAEVIETIRQTPSKTCVVAEPLRLRDDSQCMAEARSTSLDYHGRQARLVVISDRSAEYDAQRRRDQALRHLQEAQSIARLGSWQLDRASGLGSYSEQVYRMLGRRVPDQPRQHRLEELLVPPDVPSQARIQRVIEDLCGSAPLQLDMLLPVLAADGQARMLHLRAESVADDAGGASVHGTLQDVTEHERSRRLLHEREEQFRELVRVLPDGVAILHQEHVLYANAACAGQFGFEGENLLGEPLQGLVDSADLALVRQRMGAAGAKGERGATARMCRRDGSLFHAGLSFGNVRYSGRDCKLLIVRDLSEPERMRDALAQSNRELQAMARRLFSLQEDERRAISRDLHDDIGQAITAMKLSAHAALDETDAERRREDLSEIVNLADSSITKLRNLSTLLRPPQLDALGLEAALRWQAGMLFRASPVRLQLDIAPLPERPSGEVEQACFRIAQESLTNVLRHASAGEVRMTLGDEERQRLRLEVVDDGDGFDPAGPRGLGLIVMRERAQSAGGTLQIDTAPGAGTRVTLCLPYTTAAPPSPPPGA